MPLPLTQGDQLFLNIPKVSLTSLAPTLSPQTSFFPVLDATQYLAVNSLTNSIDVMDSSLTRILQKGNVTDVDKTTTAYLYHRGHLVDESPESLISRYLRSTAAPSQPIAVIGLCPTYECNFRCTYCYQKTRSRPRASRTESSSPLRLKQRVRELVQDYRAHHNDEVFIELFGGEPLLPGNEEFFDLAVDLCQELNALLLITTNGFHIEDYLDRLLLNSSVIAKVSTTLDGVGSAHDVHRRPPAGVPLGDGFNQIVGGIKYCLGLGIPTHVEINIDAANRSMMNDVYRYCQSEGWFDSPIFSFGIARVDDRMFTGRRNVISEVSALRTVHDYFGTGELPSGFRIEFLKTVFHLAKAFGIHYSQREYGRDLFNYCWASSKIIYGHYLDLLGNEFRCTYTVGNPDWALGSTVVGLSDSDGWKPEGLLRNRECFRCPIAGYCGGGCAVAQKTNRARACQEELNSFSEFFQEFADVIDKKVKETVLGSASDRRLTLHSTGPCA